jgi:hypothetical protein
MPVRKGQERFTRRQFLQAVCRRCNHRWDAGGFLRRHPIPDDTIFSRAIATPQIRFAGIWIANVIVSPSDRATNTVCVGTTPAASIVRVSCTIFKGRRHRAVVPPTRLQLIARKRSTPKPLPGTVLAHCWIEHERWHGQPTSAGRVWLDVNRWRSVPHDTRASRPAIPIRRARTILRSPSSGWMFGNTPTT